MELLNPCLAASSMSVRRMSTTAARPSRLSQRLFHAGAPKRATPIPHVPFAGQPPNPPTVSAEQPEDRLARKRRQAELLLQGQKAKVDAAKPKTLLQKRFWKDVVVKNSDDGLQVHLDSRPVRTANRRILTLPPHKRALATSIALEWDNLVSAQQALKQHYIPLTSLTSRALDVQTDDAQGETKTRQDIIKMMMRYLATDTLLCWAPEKNRHDPVGMDGTSGAGSVQSLRQKQIATAEPIIAYLKTHIFPGVDIEPILDEDSIMPRAQSQMTQEVIRGWLNGLPAFELAALERGVLASKSLLVAVRLLVEWSQEFRSLQPHEGASKRFGIADAAEASSVEVTWQTNMWGEVEDTHDVEKEDLARQLGSAILLVC